MTRSSIGDAELHAFVDGELDQSQADAVLAHLNANPTDAARVDTWRRQNAAVRRAFEGTPELALPSKPVARVTDDAIAMDARDLPRLDVIRAARRRRRAVATLAAFLGGACVALLGALAVGRIGAAPEGSFANEPAPLAPAAHARRARLAWRTYAREVDRSFDRPLADRIAVAASLQRATALPRIPDWAPVKFELVAARTMPGESEPAAFLLYASPAQVRVALIAERTPEPDTPSVLNDDGGLRCLSWRAAGYSFAIVGPAEAETLRVLARETVAAFAAR